MLKSIKISVEQRKSTCLTSQKVYLSKQNIQKLGLNVGNYALLPYMNSYYVCKLYCKNIPDDFCIINSEIKIVKPLIPIASFYPISNVYGINVVQIDLIFCSIETCLKWKQEKKVLADMLKRYVLKSYVFCSGCKINLSGSKYFKLFGINEVVIHSITLNSNYDARENLKFGKVINISKIEILNLFSFEEYQHILKPNYNPIFGFENEIKKLSQLIAINKFLISSKQIKFKTSKQFLIVGPCGIGKKSLIYTIASTIKLPIVSLSGPKLFKQDPGESEKHLREVFHNAKQLSVDGSPCILLLEDIENLCPKLTINSPAHITRISSQLLKLLDDALCEPTLLIIATTNNVSLLHMGLRRSGRLDVEIHMKLPSENDRFNILEYWIKHTFGQALNGPDIIQISRSISRITPGYTGADIKLVCQKVQIYINRQNEIITQNFANFKKIFTSIIHNTYPSSLQIYSSVLRQNELSLKDIGGLDAIISLLYRAIEWPIKYPEIFNQMGVAQPKGVLLYGPPGCAKTTLACAIAKQINFSFFSISAAELYSPYVGVAEVTLTSLFQQARQNAPSIIFIDEIDAIFGNRSSDNHNEVQNRLLSGLLMEMDGISNKLDSMIGCEVVQSPGIFIIAATNRPEALDSALLRPGRFDQILYVSPPDDKARLEILKKITQKIPLHPNVDINKLVLMTAQYSGADLVKLCKEAVLEAMTTEGLNIHEIKSDFFEKALNKNKPSLTKQQLSWYKKNRV